MVNRLLEWVLSHTFIVFSMKELQERLKANELRQKDIDRQLQSLEDEGNMSDR